MTTEVNNVEKTQRLENLLKETNETLAQDFAKQLQEGKMKQFSVVDLWKMEKTQRSAIKSCRWN